MAPPRAPLPDGTFLHVGNATLLLRCAGFTILTDPNFLHQGERAHLGYGLSSKRLREPALSVEELPPLDVVVLSHLHGDHFDRRARNGLDRSVPIVTTRQAAKALRSWGFSEASAVATWERWSTHRDDGSGLAVTSLPGAHAFGFLGKLLPHVMGSLLEFTQADGRTYRIYLSGDTLVFDGFDEIGRRHPDIDVGFVHLGGTRILGATVTMDGPQGVDALHRVRPRTAVPIHYEEYGVMRSPLSDFTTVAAAAKRPFPEIQVVDRGVTTPLPHLAQRGS